jgi:nucleotide-binding universal stress UspA family protein
MFHKILAAVDTSKVNRHVLDRAVELAKLTGAQLNIVHVLSPEEEGCPNTTGYLKTYYSSPEASDKEEVHSQKLWEEFSQKCLQMVQSQADEAQVAGVKAECCQLPGSPGRTICEVARTWGADLIVIGRRGHLSKVEEFLLGSASNYVLHHASCMVMVVPRFG